MSKTSPPLRHFEECYDIIKNEINKKRGKWTLTSVTWMDFDDVSQIILAHIARKWPLWDQTRPLEPWVATIISNQISNIIRNNYSAFSRPCLKCDLNEGGDLCSLYGTQCSRCPLYAQWEKSKKRQAHNIKMALPLENHESEVMGLENTSIDIPAISKKIHTAIQPHLRPLEWRIYKILYIDNKSEQEAAIMLGYKSSEKHREAGYRTIHNAKKKILSKVHEILKNEEIDIM